MVIWVTSLVKCPINLPVWELSINFVSAEIRLASISHWTSFFTSSETSIIKIFAKYKDKPFVIKATIIKIGITNISVWSFSINIFLIAGSSRYAIEAVLPATNKAKNADNDIFFKCLTV